MSMNSNRVLNFFKTRLSLFVKIVRTKNEEQIEKTEAGFLTACLQYLREEAYRRGVRDAVRAAAQALDGGKVQRGLGFFRDVLERLASASTEGASLSGGGDLSARALREVSKKVVGMQGTHMVTWNCLLYTSPSPRDISGSRMPSSA